jgi:ESS family glutamate:Na+ symporter
MRGQARVCRSWQELAVGPRAAERNAMTRDVSRFLAPDFLSLTIGIVVYFVGVLTTQRVKFLRNFSIPEPVSGGFIAVAVISLIYFVFNLEIDFDLTTRDRLLVIFFATVGINARIADLVAGGRTVLVLCLFSFKTSSAPQVRSSSACRPQQG